MEGGRERKRENERTQFCSRRNISSTVCLNLTPPGIASISAIVRDRKSLMKSSCWVKMILGQLGEPLEETQDGKTNIRFR